MPKPVKKTGAKDANHLAHGLVRHIIDTHDTPQPPTPDEVSRVMAALGRKGGRVGHMASVVLLFVWYNFVRVNQTLRVTPATEAGLASHLWSLEELVGLLDAADNKAA